MAFGDTPVDGMLKEAWDEFCDRLKEAAAIVFDDPAPAMIPARVDGMRYLSQQISFALDTNLEYNDPLHPQFYRLFGPTRKQGGDNPDCVYLSARIDGGKTYRVTGNFGDAHYVVFTTLIPNAAVPASHGYMGIRDGILVGRDAKKEWDGSFELVLSPHEHKGNWIKTSATATRFTIRQMFGDWVHERPMNVRIELVGEEPAPPMMTAERLSEALRSSGSFLSGTVKFWQRYQEQRRPGPGRQGEANVFHVTEGRKSGEMDGAPGSTGRAGCWWQVQPDEALIIEFIPPKSFVFWNFEFTNYWLISNDYRYRLCGLNDRHAVLEEDGSVRIVLAHQDPGVPNWVDCAGHVQGGIGSRWMFADSVPNPKTRLVKSVDLPKILPPNAKRSTAEERREQLRRRKIGVDRRFRP